MIIEHRGYTYRLLGEGPAFFEAVRLNGRGEPDRRMPHVLIYKIDIDKGDYDYARDRFGPRPAEKRG